MVQDSSVAVFRNTSKLWELVVQGSSVELSTKASKLLGACGAGFFCCRKTSKQDLGALSFESIAAKKHLVMFSERAPGMESLILGFVSKD